MVFSLAYGLHRLKNQFQLQIEIGISNYTCTWYRLHEFEIEFQLQIKIAIWDFKLQFHFAIEIECWTNFGKLT